MSTHTPNLKAEISAATENFLDRFGSDAPRQAEIRAQELCDAGQREAQVMWLEIAKRTRKVLAHCGKE